MEPDEDSILRDDLAVGGFDSDGFDVGVDSDDSEDYGTSDGSGGSDSEEERPVNVRKPAPKVEVVEFRDPSQQRTTASSNPLEFKSFMSSKVSKTLAANAPKTPLPTAAEAAQDKQDDLHDKELMSLLRSTQLIEQLTSAELQGAERRSYLAQRAVELGLRPERRPKVPRAILQGMREKGKERAKKEIQELKETGMLTGSARRKIEARIDAPKRKKKFRPPPNEVGTVGRMNKEGILVVSKRTIKQVEREGEREKAARKRKRDPFGDSSAPKSKGKKKGGKKKRR
ncbi:hypothetical protein DFJ74DRAFT_607172 [Hyaloraphidium curvatum]|nr:hypothetical protein DFJ74DRAFT_607172 [Hyaloraphidium curvatum]